MSQERACSKQIPDERKPPPPLSFPSEEIVQRGVWQCSVKTSDIAMAGTDANGAWPAGLQGCTVYRGKTQWPVLCFFVSSASLRTPCPPPHSSVFIQVYGSKGKTVPIPIRNKTDNFERNKEDVFDIEFANVGRLYKLRVWHDDKCVACMQAERQACPCPVCSWYKLTHPVA